MAKPLRPERIMAATLKQLGPSDADYTAARLISDLAGHGYELIHRPAAPEPCVDHPNTALNAHGHCPICGPKGL